MTQPHTDHNWAREILRSTAAMFALLVCVCSTVLATAAADARAADGPGAGRPWIVSVGDSYISGEAGRWAGNSNTNSSSADALGDKAYDDNFDQTAELIPGCHRSRSAEVHIGGGVGGENLACSGATVHSFTTKGEFKPGLDFYNSDGHEGQALMLQRFAHVHDVKLVALSIGGNDFKFSGIVESCIRDFFVPFLKIHCHDKDPATTEFSPFNVRRVRAAIAWGIENIHRAMLAAGYQPNQFTILVQDYPSPIPPGAGIRYPQTNERRFKGGCGLWDVDADAANSMMLPTINQSVFAAVVQDHLADVKTMELTVAFARHRLCARGVGLLEEQHLSSWRQPGAAERSEWISQVWTLLAVFGPYKLQEDLHPNYWGQLALRNCLRQAYDGGRSHGGTCTEGVGVNADGEPNMILR